MQIFIYSFFETQFDLLNFNIFMTSSEPSETPQKRCLVCGGTPNGSRYGALACLGCIVFFRRAISNANVKNCDNNSNCKIGFGEFSRTLKIFKVRFLETKNCCRSCRLQKCLQVGMNPKGYFLYLQLNFEL